MIELINALNQFDFKAFPQKNNPKRLTISAQGPDGKRHFITRTAIGIQGDGSPNYQWAKGNEMRNMQGNAPAAPAPQNTPVATQ